MEGASNTEVASIVTSQGEQALLSSYLNNVNGPYGYSTFKQVRSCANWLMRYQIKNNILSFIPEIGEERTVTSDGSLLSVHKDKYGPITNITETPITEQHNPLEMIATISDGFDEEKLMIKGSYSNEKQFFKNKILNVETSREITDSRTFDDFKSLLDNEITPLYSFDKIYFKQTVFPKNIYTYSKNNRARPEYSSKIWNNTRTSRTETNVINGFGGFIPSQSYWPLDAPEDFVFGSDTTKRGGSNSLHSFGGSGILQNRHASLAGNSNFNDSSSVDTFVTSSIFYSRPHNLASSLSVRNPALRHAITQLGTIGHVSSSHGQAVWEAGTQAGFFNSDGDFQKSQKIPFPDSYDEWSESFKGLAKGYSLVPEFRMSDHIGHYLTNGYTSAKLDFLDVKGGNSVYNKSSQTDFYKVYSTTDFLKNFEVIRNDLSSKSSPTSITLRCKAIKKFLPYEGFYPCQRTVELAKQFYNSYGLNVSGSSWGTHQNLSASNTPGAKVDDTSKYISQNLITPLFAPGILFNTIKSGIACDFPIKTLAPNTSSTNFTDPHSSIITEQYALTSNFDKRVPFEALMEPEKHLANEFLFSIDPEIYSPKVKTIWNGQGDDLYKLMINNFVSEVGDFFLENERHSTIASLPEGDPNFGNVQNDKVYCMRIKMYRSSKGNKQSETSHNGFTYGVPQDAGSNLSLIGDPDNFPQQETFTMYSRPTSFGPPQAFKLNQFSTLDGGFNWYPSTWKKFKYPGSLNYAYNPEQAYEINIFGNITPLASHGIYGNNYAFTPPYYHGDAWADVFFKPPTGAKKYSLSEIINNCSIEFFRVYYTGSIGVSNPDPGMAIINDQAMQLASSVNLFSRGIFRQDIEQVGNVTVDTQLENKYRWIVQSKWETPALNFNHLTHTDLTMPKNHATASVPIVMWHQYGRLPQKTDEGVFLQITDIPPSYIQGALIGDINKTGSLIDLCGFSNDPVRVGEVKNAKLIEEAVVAVPFVNRNGFREFFKLKKEDVHRAINGIEEAVGPTVFKLTQQLDKYVFPPQFDYKRNKDTKAVAMYVFEFSHEFTKQDLADIWQNLPPKLGEVHETAEATVSHSLFAEEFLGAGASPQKTATGIEREIVSELTDLPADIQWMVFKVKKRAKTNYFEKMFERNESREGVLTSNITVDSTGRKTDVSYNWPYDFFSMVELVKLDAEIEFSNVDKGNSKQNKKLVTKPYYFKDED